jgi:pSer/pThr/pTyr-binding forkhead associated (FHA) protein
MPVLHIRIPGKGEMKYEMTESQATVGRQRGNTVTLAGDTGISRTHCRIRKAGEGFAVEDAGSANGTRLNGRNIGKSTERLYSGDRIGIGSTEIVFDDPLSPKRSLISRLKESLLGGRDKGGKEAASRTTSDGTVFGDGFIKCGKCGARIHTGNKGAGQKVGCSRCRALYVIPPK